MEPAMVTIEWEHRALAAVLHGLKYLVDEIAAGKPRADPRVFRAMVHYIDAFPERFHHPKEDRHLFARVRARTHEADDVLDELERQHGEGQRRIRDLEQALLRFEEGGNAYFGEFAKCVEDYVQYYWGHMRLEEDVVFPLALRVLTKGDWHEINEAFSGHTDPMISDTVDRDFSRLFTRIVNIAPPPIGVGPEASAA
jgi:hemerythrin-like domain-containing protein